MLEHPSEGRSLGGGAAKGQQGKSTGIAVQKPPLKVVSVPRRVKLVSNLILVALLGVILLTLTLWVSGFRLPFLPSVLDEPSLTLSSGPYRVGGSITIQGAHFSHFSIIVLLLDGEPATDSNGLHLAVDSDGQGAFNTILTILPVWGSGDHILGAKDTTSGQQALVDISIEKPSGLRRSLLAAHASQYLFARQGQQGQQVARQQPGVA